MQTRQQSSRQREVEATAGLQGREGIRSTRQRRATPEKLVTGLAARSAPQRRPVDAKKSDTMPGSLVKDPAPRRGAPVEKAFSITNTSVRNGNQSQGEEVEDSDGDDAESLGSRDSAAQELDSNAEEVEEGMQQFLTEILPDLERATTELMKHLRNQDPENEVHRRVLGVKSAVFMGLRDKYQAAKTRSILIDWTKPGALRNLVGADPSAIRVFAQANQVATLHYIQLVQTQSNLDRQAFLQTLNTSFPALFRTPDLVNPCPDIIVKIRACYLIEILAGLKSKAQALDAIARIFCETSDNVDYGTLCKNGPYKRLGGEDQETDHEKCSTVVDTILACLATPKKKLWLETLRQKFRLEELLRDVERWMERMYDEVAREAADEYVGDGQENSDGSEGSDDGRTCIDTADPQQTLFVDESSLERLAATGNRVSVDRPRDERQLSAAVGSKRAQDDSANDGDFERDHRVLDHLARYPGRESWQTRAPVLGRRGRESRFAKAPRSSAAAGASPSTAAVLSSSARPTPSGSAGASDEALRVALSTAYTRRRAWTDRDTDVLIELIGKTSAFYALIERHYKHHFECPRGQQAYRDKARNVKVDYLLNDECLPLEFDRVSLGPKEIRKLQAAGKNPFRKEKDVDDAGRPTNTVWLE